MLTLDQWQHVSIRNVGLGQFLFSSNSDIMNDILYIYSNDCSPQCFKTYHVLNVSFILCPDVSTNERKDRSAILQWSNKIQYHNVYSTFLTNRKSIVGKDSTTFLEDHVFNHKLNVIIGTNLISFTQIDMTFFCDKWWYNSIRCLTTWCGLTKHEKFARKYEIHEQVLLWNFHWTRAETWCF